MTNETSNIQPYLIKYQWMFCQSYLNVSRYIYSCFVNLCYWKYRQNDCLWMMEIEVNFVFLCFVSSSFFLSSLFFLSFFLFFFSVFFLLSFSIFFFVALFALFALFLSLFFSLYVPVFFFWKKCTTEKATWTLLFEDAHIKQIFSVFLPIFTQIYLISYNYIMILISYIM